MTVKVHYSDFYPEDVGVGGSTAPPASKVSVSTLTDRLADAEVLVQGAADSVQNLENVFGDTVSAAESAIAAGEAADLAALKAGDASTAASASNISAGIATTKADEAINSATGASIAADTATIKATEAENSASAANAAKLSADAAQGLATEKAAAAVISAAQAAASDTSAGQSATASEGSATTAATRAGEALTYRNQASDARDGAVTARDESRTAASSSQAVANRLMPDRVSGNADFYDANAWAAPENTVPLASGTNVTTPDQGLVREFTGSLPIASRGWRKIEPDRTYRFTTTTRIITGAAGNNVRNGFIVFNANAEPIGYWFEFPLRASAGGWVTYTRSISATELLGLWQGAVYIRPCVHSGISSGGAGLPGVVWQVSVLRAEDVTESALASAAAATAIAQSSSASESAAEASISAYLATQVGQRPNLLANSDFSNGLVGWTPISGAWGTYVHAQFGPLAHSTVEGNTYLQSDFVRVDAGATYTVSLNGDPGPAGSAAIYFQYFDANKILVSDGNALTGLDGMSWTARRGSTFTPPAGIAFVRIIFYRAAASTYPLHVTRIMFAFGAEMVPWNDSATTISVQSSLAITAKTTAGSTGQALLDVTGGAGGDPFNIELKAGPGASSATMTASKVALKNIVNGTIVDALELQGGNAVLRGNLTAGGGIYLGSGTVWAVALRPQTFTRGDGETISFGGANIGIPTYEFMRDNLLPLAAGESYDLQIKNLTAAGGTVWAKINIPGAPSAQSLAGPGTVPGSGPTRQNVKSPKPDSTNGNYTITLGGTYSFRIFANTEWQDYEGSVSVGIFAKKAGVWTRVGALTANWYISTDNPSSVNQTEMVYWETVDTVQMGEGIEAFGATIEGSSGPLAGRAVVLNSLGPISWSSQGSASGTKSALASGTKTSIKITPQG